METKLTVPIAAKDLGGASKQVKAAVAAGAEMLELRTDYLENLTALLVKKLVGEGKAAGVPVIVTCRDKRQGGVRAYPLQLRIEVLAGALGPAPNLSISNMKISCLRRIRRRYWLRCRRTRMPD